MDDTFAGISTKNFDLSHERMGINNGRTRNTVLQRSEEEKGGGKKGEFEVEFLYTFMVKKFKWNTHEFGGLR